MSRAQSDALWFNLFIYFWSVIFRDVSPHTQYCCLEGTTLTLLVHLIIYCDHQFHMAKWKKNYTANSWDISFKRCWLVIDEDLSHLHFPHVSRWRRFSSGTRWYRSPPGSYGYFITFSFWILKLFISLILSFLFIKMRLTLH